MYLILSIYNNQLHFMHNQRITNIQGTNQLHQLTHYNGAIQVMGSNNNITLVQCESHLNIMGTGNIITINKCYLQIKIYGSQNIINIQRSDLDVSCYGSSNQIKIFDKQNISRVNLMENNGYDNTVIACPRNIVPNNLHIIQEEQKKQPINPVRSIRSVSNPEIQRRRLNQAQRYWRERLQHNQVMFTAQRNVIQRQGQHEQMEKQQKIQGLTQQQIDKLPIHQKDKNDNKNCSICLERIAKGEDQMFLLCFHSFHSGCCSDWLQKSSTCPICNLNMKEQLRKAI